MVSELSRKFGWWYDGFQEMSRKILAAHGDRKVRFALIGAETKRATFGIGRNLGEADRSVAGSARSRIGFDDPADLVFTEVLCCVDQ